MFKSNAKVVSHIHTARRTSRIAAIIAAVCLALAGGGSIAAAGEPCEPAWHPFTSGGQIGVDGTVAALTEWNGDPVAGGWFLTAGGQTVDRIARWDGSAWHPFAGGLWGGLLYGSHVAALTVWNGDLIVGGELGFAGTGGQPCCVEVRNIVRWDGSAWHPITSAGGYPGLNGLVRSLTVWNGSLVAGGDFAQAGGPTLNRIARWDSEMSEWQPFISGGQIGVSASGDIPYLGVFAMTVWNGDLIAGGHFDTAGGQTVNRIARWDGEAWHPFTSAGQTGVSGAIVFALTVWNGDLIAGGNFTTAGGQIVNGIARWDGSAWHPFISGGQIGVRSEPGHRVLDLAVWNGDLIAGGIFPTAGGQTVNDIARWDGERWHPFTAGRQVGVDGMTSALMAYNGDLIAGGSFPTAGGQTVNRIARWDGCVEPECAPADLDCDGVVDVSDLVMVIGAWGPCPQPPADCPADLSGDSTVGVADLLILLANWG